jgi:hypothetical protein
MNITVSDFTARGRDGKPAAGVRAGFLMVSCPRRHPPGFPLGRFSLRRRSLHVDSGTHLRRQSCTFLFATLFACR